LSDLVSVGYLRISIPVDDIFKNLKFLCPTNSQKYNAFNLQECKKNMEQVFTPAFAGIS
jgi:hypothetical protein